MNVKCPHCGIEYEVEQSQMYRYAKCEICGKGFVVGTTSSRREDLPPNDPSPVTQEEMSSSNPQEDARKNSVPSKKSKRIVFRKKFVQKPQERELEQCSGKKANWAQKYVWVWGLIGLLIAKLIVAYNSPESSLYELVFEQPVVLVDHQKALKSSVEYYERKHERERRAEEWERNPTKKLFDSISIRSPFGVDPLKDPDPDCKCPKCGLELDKPDKSKKYNKVKCPACRHIWKVEELKPTFGRLEDVMPSARQLAEEMEEEVEEEVEPPPDPPDTIPDPELELPSPILFPPQT